MHFESRLEKFNNKVWGYYLPVPLQIAQKFIERGNRRVSYVLNSTLKLHGALMPRDDAYFLLMNETNVNKLSLQLGDIVSIKLEKDNTEYGMPMPESFQALLDQDESGNEYFNALSPGKQRNLIYIVSKVKNVDKQINKGIAI